MRWNTITSSSTPCFAHCLGHQCKICSHLLLFIFQLLEVRELFSGIWRSIGHEFHKTFQKIRTISVQKKDYLCSLLTKQTAKQVCFETCEAPFAVSKQTTKHTLQFQTFLCSFHQSTSLLCKGCLRSSKQSKLKANCKGTLHFDLKFYCFLKNFVRFMPNTFQNDIQKTSEWIKSMWWTWKKCCNPGLSNNYPVTL